ncbi:MAG TPA: hypothetical protein VIB99_10735 [Candidatus Limnocylindrales bacterium]|jgi:hypothetical protein
MTEGTPVARAIPGAGPAGSPSANPAALAAPAIRPNPTAFLVSLVVVLLIAVALFAYFGLASLPVGQSPQQAAGYFGARLIPFGLILMIVGFAETLALAIGQALASPDRPVEPRTIGLSTLAELLRAVTGLSATPAGIGALITLLGAFLLVGSGAAAATIP